MGVAVALDQEERALTDLKDHLLHHLPLGQDQDQDQGNLTFLSHHKTTKKINIQAEGKISFVKLKFLKNVYFSLPSDAAVHSSDIFM